MPAFDMTLAICALAAVAASTWAAGRVAASGFPLGAPDKRIGCVDGLRGYLALSVMLHHFVIWVQDTRLGGGWQAPESNLLNQLGAGAVGLFFMTTGLVFYPRILAGFRATGWPGVMIGRAYRIVPLVAFSVAVIAAIIFLRRGDLPGPDFGRALLTWITAQGQPPLLGDSDAGRLNAYVLWSLKLEWLFYLLVLPMCALAMDVTRALRLPSWTVPAGLFAVSLALQLAAGDTLSEGSLIRYLPLFAAGMGAWELQALPANRRRLGAPGMALPAAIALAAGMVVAPTPYGASLPLFAFFFVCVACGNSFGGLLTTRGALVLGECSFGIYILHGIVLDLFFTSSLGGLVPLVGLPLALPALMVVVALATPASFLLIERPAMARGRVLARRLTGHAAKPRELEVAP